MRSKFVKKVLDRTPAHTKVFSRLCADLTVRVNNILEEKGITQKELARQLKKQPSEISKWLSGEHNFTLRSLAKLEAELGEPLLRVPPKAKDSFSLEGQFSLTVTANSPIDMETLQTSTYKELSIPAKAGKIIKLVS